MALAGSMDVLLLVVLLLLLRLNVEVSELTDLSRGSAYKVCCAKNKLRA
jgi:hypothetical protein